MLERLKTIKNLAMDDPISQQQHAQMQHLQQLISSELAAMSSKSGNQKDQSKDSSALPQIQAADPTKKKVLEE